MNSPEFVSTRRLLEDCVVFNDAVTLDLLLRRFAELIAKAFATVAPTNLRYADFIDWFPGWLIASGKLYALYRALREKIVTGEISSDADVELYVCNYLVNIVRSAVGDWYREHKPLRRYEPPRSDEVGQRIVHERTEQVRVVLIKLPQRLRIPFWLRHYYAIGPMLPPDLDWLCELNACTPEALVQEIEKEVQSMDDATRPLSSEFIGELMALPPRNGKYMAVDQRIYRAKALIRLHFESQQDTHDQASS